MKFSCNSVDLETLGSLRIGEVGVELLPPELPRRRRVTLQVQLDFFKADWAANRTQVDAVKAAIANPHPQIVWINDEPDTPVTIVNQTAALVGNDLPEDVNLWGTRHQAIILKFQYDEAHLTPDRFLLKYTPSGGSETTLGEVYGYKKAINVERYHPLRKNRNRVAGKVTFRGEYLISATSSLADRRSAAISAAATIDAAMNSASGVLEYKVPSGSTGFSGTVRITGYTFDADQLTSTGIPWTLDAEYSMFPDEASYTMAEFSVRSSSSTFGPKTVALSGSVAGDSRAACDTKLDAIRSAYVPSGALVTSAEPTESRLDADGATFIRLDFSETYRVDRAATKDVAVQYTLDINFDYPNNVKQSRLAGVVFCHDREDGATAVAMIVSAFSLGTLQTKRTGESRVKLIGDTASTSDDLPSGTDPSAESYGGFLDQYTFDLGYESKISGDAAILKVDVSEEIQASGIRWVARPTSYGRDVMQACGIQSGSRRISGEVTATTESAAFDYLNRQYHFPWRGGTVPSPRYVHPSKWTVKPKFSPMVNGITRAATDALYTGGSGSVNENCVSISFEFSETLPAYDYVPTS